MEEQDEQERVGRLRVSCGHSHEALDRHIRTLAALVDDEASAEEVVRELGRLLTALETHFREEEASDLFGWLRERFSSLQPELERLRAEHTGMLRSLRALHEERLEGGGEADWPVHLRMAIADLHNHELGERDVVDAAEALVETPAPT